MEERRETEKIEAAEQTAVKPAGTEQTAVKQTGDSGAKPPALAKKKRKRKKGKKLFIILTVVLIAGLGAFYWYHSRAAAVSSAAEEEVQTAEVTRRNISSELSESSSLEPKDTYEVTSLVEGEIIACYFEEGDQVEKDQVLYVIDSSSTESSLSSAETSLTRAQESLQSAQKDYNEAASELAGNTYKSTGAGYIRTLYVKVGDKVNNGAQIADIYDDSVMELRVPFLSAEADQIAVGSTALITLEDTGEQLEGTVASVSSMEEALSGGRLVKQVSIEVSNPGGLTDLTRATASVGDFLCSQEGTFEAKVEYTMTADLSGNQALEVESLLLAEGARVEVGTPIFQATAASVGDYLKNFEDALETADDNVTNAQNQLEDVQDNIDSYTIKAPISGTVISRNANVGENITRNTGSTTVLATIYDLSEMTFQISVDELDVASVEVGQTVEITADAMEGETYTGTVTNVSLESSYSNGVSTYPVTVAISDYGDLLPGMNVDARIITGSSEQALVVPAGALMRGNRVYVTEDSPTAQALLSGDGSDAGNGPDGAAPETPEGMELPEGAELLEGASSGIGQGGAPEGFVAVSVKTGIVNDDYVEILSGLQEGDTVYVDPDAGSSSTGGFMMMVPGGMGGPGGGMGGGPGGGPGNPR